MSVSIPFTSVCPAPARLAVALVCAFTLGACGGGGSGAGSQGDSGGGTRPDPVTASGRVVIDQAVRGATVCVDLDGDGVCGPADPAAPATGDDGGYRLSYQAADAAALAAFHAAPRLAAIPTTAVDMADSGDPATRRAYVMAAPASLAAQINPLTTLVQRGVGKGMTVAVASRAVAGQLGIAEAKIANYQDDPSSAQQMLAESARTAAKLTAYALELGGVLNVVAPDAAPEASRALSALTYTDAANYTYRLRVGDGVPDADGYTSQTESRSGKAGGVALTQAQLFPVPASVQLTAHGWDRCDGTPPRLSTRGSPGRTRYCDGATLHYGFTVDTENLAGLSIADTLARMAQGHPLLEQESVRRDATLAVPAGATGAAVFPAGASLRTTLSVQLNQPIVIPDTSAAPLGFASLASLVASRPAGAVDLANGGGMIGGLGLHDANHVLRAAFVDGATAQFYRCAGTAPDFLDRHSCTALQQSAFTIDTVGGARVMRFAAFPATTLDHTRGYAEYDGAVHVYRQKRTTADEGDVISYSQRLNGTAWDALKAALGL